MVSTAGGIVIAVIVILLAAAIGWVVFTQLRARKLGLPPPSLSSYLPWHRSEPSPYGPPRPAPGGVVGWFNDQVRKFKNRGNRSAAGAYEQPLHPGSGAAGAPRGGFGPLDPDDAWDARVGHEADSYGYYEEQELGGVAGGARGGGGSTSEYPGGGSYAMNLPSSGRAADDDRGRAPTRAPAAGGNPFDDDNADSLRGVSPRPIDTGAAGAARRPGEEPDSAGSSPVERRSVFRENV